MAFGVLVRLVQYLANRSLWADEAVLALNLINRSYAELFQPLDYNQAAPIGFLLIEKFLLTIFGNNEYVLRLFPLLCAIFSLFCFHELAKNLLQRQTVPIALALFVSLEYLVYYASEVKQYSSDVAVAVGLCWMMLPLLRQNSLIGNNARKLILYTVVGSIAIWLSHPAIFVLAALGTIALVRAVRSQSRLAILSVFGIGTVWLLSFLGFYLTSLLAVGDNSDLFDSWGKGFMPSLWAIDWLFDRLVKFFDRPLGFPENFIGDIALVFCFIGYFSLWKQNRQGFSIVLLPVGFTLLASYLKKYPFRDRLLLFLTPFFILAIAEGIGYLWRKTSKTRVKLVTAIAIVLILIPPLASTAYLLVQPQTREEIKPTIAYVKQNQEPGDLLYIFQRGEYQFKYYAPKYGYSEGDYIIGVDDLEDGEKVSPQEWQRYQQDFDRLRGNPRVWMLFSHTDGAKEEEEMVLSYIETIGKKIDSFESVGACVYLYNFR
ncbi:MAG: glycosyltransferase family 39 protein [Geitlerinemataceae cyanobacterium]